MAAPQIYGSYRSVSGSKMLETLGAALQSIKDGDELTDADMAAEIGKSEDQAGAYRKATSEMSATTFLRACKRWNGRFANPVFALFGLKLVPLESVMLCARKGLTIIMAAATALNRYLEDGELTDDELLESRSEIEEAAAVFDGLRRRLAHIDGRN